MNKFAIILSKLRKKKKKNKEIFHFSNENKIVFLLDDVKNIQSKAIQNLCNDLNFSEMYYFIFQEGNNKGIDTVYYFDEQKLDFFGKWKDVHLKDIIEKKFDLMIDFSVKNDRFFNYIIELCESNFVVSYRDNVKPDLQINLQHFNQETYAKEILRIIKLYT